MGSWGASSFENDDALDWISQLSAPFEWQEIGSLLSTGSDCCASVGACSQIVAACELVAAGIGHPAIDLPVEAASFVSTCGAPPLELVSQASEALEQLASKSALREVWQQSGSLREWRGQITRLKKRLGLAPQPIVSKPPKPLSIEELGLRANKQMTAERFRDAIQTLDAILALDWNRATTHNNKAWCLAHCDQLDLAKAEIAVTFQIISENSNISPSARAACFGTRGYIHLKTQNYEEALEDLSTSLEIIPRTVNFKHRAEALQKLGRVEDAACEFALHRQHQIKDRLKKARQLWGDERYQESRAELSLILEEEPKHIVALSRRAHVLSEMKQLEEAESDLSTLLETYGDNPYFFFERAQIRAQLNRTALARQDRERCHKLGIDMIAFYENYIKLQAKIIEAQNIERITKAAIPNLNLILKMVPEHQTARTLKIKALKIAGSIDQAKREQMKYDKMQPLPEVESKCDMLPWGEWFWKLMTSDEEAFDLVSAWATKSS